MVVIPHERFRVPRQARRNRDTLPLDHRRLHLPAAHRNLLRHRVPGLHPDRRVRAILRDSGIDQRRAGAAGAEAGERVEIGCRSAFSIRAAIILNLAAAVRYVTTLPSSGLRTIRPRPRGVAE